MPYSLEDLTLRLGELAHGDDLTGFWPAASMRLLDQHECRRWMIPSRFGGLGLSPIDLIRGYESIARGSMAVALIFTQHDAAVDIIFTGENDGLIDRLAPDLAGGRLLLTVGISQLTTSHQQGPPAMRVEFDGKRARFTGLMPWVTAAEHADMIVTGGVTADGGQWLAVVPAGAAGLTIDPPLQLAALQSTHTAVVHCDGVTVDADWIIRGPVARALAVRGTVRPMVVSATGVGLSGAMVSLIATLPARRDPELCSHADSLIERYECVRRELYAAADGLADSSAEGFASGVRVAVNDLLVRLAVLLTTLGKGGGYLKSNDAQRLVREALFFLVWSAPVSIQRDTLGLLL